MTCVVETDNYNQSIKDKRENYFKLLSEISSTNIHRLKLVKRILRGFIFKIKLGSKRNFLTSQSSFNVSIKNPTMMT